MLQSGRVPRLTPALILGVAVLAGCSDSATAPSSADAVRFPASVNRVVAQQTEEVCSDITFEGLAHGTVVTALTFDGNNLTVTPTAFNPDGSLAANPQARIYAGGTHQGGPDFDLQSTGAGALCGACTSNMLVIQEVGGHEGGQTSDNTWGGTITITGFAPNTYWVESFQLADHEVAAPPIGEPDAQLIINGSNRALVGQPQGVNTVITVPTTSQPLIDASGIRFVLGNPPTQQGSEGIDNIKICKNVTTTTGCTYTKGWYQNKNGAPTVIGVDGRTKAEAQAIFAATPGKPGNVTWGVDNKPNNLLNLYQQLLAALNNLGGNATAGPDAVDEAIADALAGTGGTGLNITTTLTEQEIGELADLLASFNEGKFAGWPHCQVIVRL